MAKCPFAEWRGPVPNMVPFRAGPTQYVVVHVMQSNPHGDGLDACDSWFHNPASQVSAHFGVGRDGRLFQWVDTDDVAWAEAAYNGRAVSIEHEGDTGQELTPVQLAVSLRVQHWVMGLYDTVPPEWSTHPSRLGVIPHSALGVPGGNHPDCPGLPIQRQFAAAYRPHPAPSTERKAHSVQTPHTLPVPSKQSRASLGRQAAAGTGLVAAFTGNLPHVPGVSPTAVFVTTTIVSAALFVVEHWLGDPSTGNPPTPLP